MADIFSNLVLGFSVALTLKNIALCFLGCLIGTLVGVLPGVGPIATIAILLPITLTLDPVGALIMLAGIYYGAQYGGSTTAILVNIPGEATSVVTALEGHEMAKRGQAGVALGLSAIASFIAGTVATVFIAAIGAPLTALGLLFGPAEYFSLMVMGLTFAVVLAHGSVLKAVAMILVGVLLSTVGTDIETGRERLSFDIAELSEGIDFAIIAMGIFGDVWVRSCVEQGWVQFLAYSQEMVPYLLRLLRIHWRRSSRPKPRDSVAGRPKVWRGLKQQIMPARKHHLSLY